MMQMESEGHDGGNHYHCQSAHSDRALNRETRSPTSPRVNSIVGGAGGVSYIAHPVSKMDTLAGVAIKYGVEVADIKKINGLVTDLQMFAFKSLQIPTPGRHPPSPCLSNGCDMPGSKIDRSSSRRHSDLFDSFQALKNTSPHSKVSPAARSLQDYCGLQPGSGKTACRGCEMAHRRKGDARHLEYEFRDSAPPSSRNNRLPTCHRNNCRSLASGGSATENSETRETEADCDKSREKLIRRRQKSEGDFCSSTSETSAKDNCIRSGRKGSSSRPKSVSQTGLRGGEADAGWLNPVGLGDSFVADGFTGGVKKSSSVPDLPEQDRASPFSVWPASGWSVMPDSRAPPGAAASTRPMFDGLPKPMVGRRNKAALD